jgi:sugar phosphate isomerase/epimerase
MDGLSSIIKKDPFKSISMSKNFMVFVWLLSGQLFNHPVSGQGRIPLYTAPLGIEGYTFRNSFPKNLKATLDTIQTMGFKEMESSSYGMPPVEFKKLCDARGIRIVATGGGYDKLVKSPDSLAEEAELLGASYLMCSWVPHKGLFNLENAKKAVEDFNQMGKILKQHGLTFCYHAHGYEFQPYEDGTLLDYIINNTNPEYVSFEMDIFWIQFGGGDPVSLLKKYGSRWKLMHLKDLRKGTSRNPGGSTSPENDVPLGTGELDIPSILKESRRIGIAHFFIEDESNQPNIQVPQSIRYLKSLTLP